jgi:hypothetical protein
MMTATMNFTERRHIYLMMITLAQLRLTTKHALDSGGAAGATGLRKGRDRHCRRSQLLHVVTSSSWLAAAGGAAVVPAAEKQVYGDATCDLLRLDILTKQGQSAKDKGLQRRERKRSRPLVISSY